MSSKRKFILPTPEEDADINAGIAQDPDNPELIDENFKRMRPASEIFPEMVMAHIESKKGRGPQKTPTKERITIRLDSDITEYFRSYGDGWQSKLNQALKEYIRDH
ncbi:BrnA antitoxin family protein [Azomonas macrocytogenes]|uniref:Uncharacterized protein (DUF4415 family) n=1 Tax=Azomonas macrocytogenes TaxID=69962 RepID=A0A839T094_AZOMA|nr:BrnA antitoxin family protein [Azomonas macrocytogenes]MBB3102558.1 uncharacterized protein (DUF4415 family) [Azomonas macrocytogenes]